MPARVNNANATGPVARAADDVPRAPERPAGMVVWSGPPRTARDGDGFAGAGEPQLRLSADGTPIYAQSDPRWGSRTLGKELTISAAGCAMTATAMAISKISGDPINPKELDAYLDRRKGYSGDALDWHKAAAARGMKTSRERWSLDTIDSNLEQGRPVVVGVDYKPGSAGGARGTDHWICITSKGVDDRGRTYYSANDPGTGKVITLYPDTKGRLLGDGKDALGKYKSTGQLNTFEPR
ncbi:MAG: C39 family peptidase [Myxococcales bacterium]|nr:C39 family peptidase [Myxococcales bacterium]